MNSITGSSQTAPVAFKGGNPGSDEARESGCVCPILDNGHGKRRDGMFWINESCPLHGKAELMEDAEEID